MRLALGAKWGWPRGNRAGSAPVARAERRFGFSRDPSAAAPTPTAVRLKKCRRVISRLCSRRGSIISGSTLGDGFVQIQDHTRDGRPGCQFAAVERGLRLEAARADQFLGAGRVFAKV